MRVEGFCCATQIRQLAEKYGLFSRLAYNLWCLDGYFNCNALERTVFTFFALYHIVQISLFTVSCGQMHRHFLSIHLPIRGYKREKKKMIQKTPIQLLEDPVAFICKVVELSMQKEIEDPFDEFIIELMHWEGEGLFAMLLKIYGIAVSETKVAFTRSVDVNMFSNDAERQNKALQEIDATHTAARAMESFMVAFYEFDPNKLK